ncbi:hypothetical protein D779_4136 [Imhoffiella purpurea]|uniref:Uncharacterized protein n=1 Tax=Imhoffiella purpurea TaxID=1249627 RepID=W9VAE0_9GAMM|nr:hypothetical protein D779_4136 [Imhoffiella purpurea]
MVIRGFVTIRWYKELPATSIEPPADMVPWLALSEAPLR